jgi:hypothetical protein
MVAGDGDGRERTVPTVRILLRGAWILRSSAAGRIRIAGMVWMTIRARPDTGSSRASDSFAVAPLASARLAGERPDRLGQNGFLRVGSRPC